MALTCHRRIGCCCIQIRPPADASFVAPMVTCPIFSLALCAALGIANHPDREGESLKAMTCGEAVMKLLAAYEVDTVFGMAGTMTVELYRGIAPRGDPPRAVSQRAGRQSHGRRLRARDRQARRLHHHRRPRRHQCGDRHRPGLLRFAAHAGALRRVRHAHAGERLGSGPRARRPGRGHRRIHRVQRDGPISGRAAGIDCSRLCACFAAAGLVRFICRCRATSCPEPVEADWKTRRAPSLPMPDPAAIEEAARSPRAGASAL